jgi:hypothetical protein
MKLTGMILSAALATFILPAAAQDSTAASPAPVPPAKTQTNYNKRQENQQDRIQQGVKSGQLTKGEAAKLEKHHRRMNREAREMRQDNGGKLTAADRTKLRNQQKEESRKINRAKHNDQTRK